MTFRKTLFLTVLAGVLLLLIPYSVPLILALLTAILLESVINLLISTLKVKRVAAVSISFILFLGVFSLGGYWVITTLIVQSMELAQRLPSYS